MIVPKNTRMAAGRAAGFGVLMLLLAGLAVSTPAKAATEAKTEATIRYLIDYIRASDVTFVRNFSEHTAAEAAEHVEKKYRHFEDKIDSPEEFIELCATKSLLTGSTYTIIDDRGRKVPSRDWLTNALDDYRNGDGQASRE